MSVINRRPPGVKVLQVNLYHSWAAQQLLRQTTHELGVDLALVSDQLSNPDGDSRWIASADRKCAVAEVSRRVPDASRWTRSDT